MKLARISMLVAAVGAAAAPIAASAAEGQLASVAGGSSALVMRDGRMTNVQAGGALFAGDRVITRGGSAKIVYGNGCSQTLGKASTTLIGSAGCANAVSSLDDDASAGASGSSSGYVVGGLALLAVIGGVVAATSNTRTRPASP